MSELEKELEQYIKSLREEYNKLVPVCGGKPGVTGRMWELQKIADNLEDILVNNIYLDTTSTMCDRKGDRNG